MSGRFGALAHDAGVAWRGLIRRPFYPLATILMLALAIGANATAFGIFYGFLLRPLPYRHPSQLVQIREKIPKVGLTGPWAIPDDYQMMKRDMPAIADAGMLAYGGPGGVKVNGVLRAVNCIAVTPSFFRTLDVRPVLGRLPSLAAGRAGGPGEIMISYKFWQSAFGGKSDVIGQELKVGTKRYRVTGVFPRHSAFGSSADIYLPLVMPISGRLGHNLSNTMIVRLAPGVTLKQFDAKLREFTPALIRAQTPKAAAYLKKNGFAVDALPVRKALLLGSHIHVFSWLLQGTALFLLLLAIANAANLALVRHQTRLHEFALRRVLGGSRGSLLRLLLLEQMPLFVAVGVIGSFLAWIASRGIHGFHGDLDEPPLYPGFGGPVLACAWVLSGLSIFIIAAAPVLQTSNRRLQAALGQGSKSTMSRATRQIQRALGIIQIMLAFALLSGSAVLGGSLYLLLTRPLGFSPDHRIVASFILPARSNNGAQVQRLVHQLDHRPFTIAAAGGGFLAFPFSEAEMGSVFERVQPGSAQYRINETYVTSGFFKTMNIPFQAGRDFVRTGKDGKVVILGAGLAHRLFGKTAATGRNLRSGKSMWRIIGVVPSVAWRNHSWQVTAGTLYEPISESIKGLSFSGAYIIIHVRGSLRAAMRQTKTLIEATVPGAVVTSMRSYRGIIQIYTSFRSLVAAMVAMFAVLALVLAALGVYAVNAFIARARLPEYGVRAMLGAGPRRLLKLALADAAWLLGFGLAGGVIGGYLLVRAMSPLLFETGAIAPMVFAISLVLIAAIVFAAAWRPAARAANTPVKRLLDAS